MPPFFSIVIPTYNRADLLPETIKSVTGQTYPDWECIVVDDGSTDHTKDVIEGFNDNRIKYFRKKHEERSIARNYGINRAKGTYICFLDSDDYYKNNHLQVLYERILDVKKEPALYYTRMEKLYNGSISPLSAYDPEKYAHPVNFVLQHFLFINSVCVHRDVFRRFSFPENFHVWEDTHLWLRVVANFPFYQIDKVTTVWNLHAGSSVTGSFEKVSAEHLNMYLACISDLQQNHMHELNGLLFEKELTAYKFGKYKLLMQTAWKNRQYNTFREGITVGKSYFNAQKINGCMLNCLLTSNRVYRTSAKIARRLF